MARVGLGLVGCGRMGSILARSIVAHVPEARLVGVADVDEGAARRLGRELGVDDVATSAAELMGHAGVDAAVIAVSSAHHLVAVEAAAARTRDVFCEKPLALTIEDTQAAIDATNRAGVRLQVGFMRRFDPAYRRAKSRLDRGEIGRPILFKSLQFDPGPPPLAYADPSVSGGIHIDMGIHDYDLARWLVADEVSDVHAWGSSLAYPELATIGDVDSAVVNLRYASGATGTVQLARSDTVEDVRTEIVGEHGVVSIGRRPSRPAGRDAGWGSGPLRFEAAYAAELRSFVRAIAHDRPVAVDGSDALAALRIALAARDSMRQGAPVGVVAA